MYRRLLLILAILFSACQGEVVTVSVDPASGETISPTQKIVITFSNSMDTSTLVLAGTMADESDGGSWSTTINHDDTLTISPKVKWSSSAVATLTVNAKDVADNTLNTLDLSYFVKITLSDFQNASVVIGQPNMGSHSSNQGGTTKAKTTAGAFGTSGFFDGKLFLPDDGNNRILILNSVPTENNATADVVVGQTNFTSAVAGFTSQQLTTPHGALIYKNKLFVLDYGNSRVLIYNSIPTSNNQAADVVVGQPSFGVISTACTNKKLNGPEAFTVVDDKLIVVDSSNHRVLIWNQIPTANGVKADVVLGQNSLNNCIANDDNQDGISGASSARTLNYPTAVWTDGTKLVISEYANNRVMIWNQFPTTNFKRADLVLGQSNFAHNTANDDDQDNAADATPSSRTFKHPNYGLTSNGLQLFVSDHDNNRVLIWDTFPNVNFQPADHVLGQGDFTHAQNNDGDQDGVDDGVAAGNTFRRPAGLLLFGNQLLVNDALNYRYVIYNGF